MIFYAYHTHFLGFSHFSPCAPPPPPPSCPTHLYPGMAAEVEVKLCWVSDAHIHCGTSRNVTTLSNLVLGDGGRREGEREELEWKGGGCD